MEVSWREREVAIWIPIIAILASYNYYQLGVLADSDIHVAGQDVYVVYYHMKYITMRMIIDCLIYSEMFCCMQLPYSYCIQVL